MSGKQIFELDDAISVNATDVVALTHYSSGNASKVQINDLVKFALSSGVIQSGHIGDSAVNSGNIASGQVSLFHLASGTTSLAKTLYTIGRNSTGVIISGKAAVYIDGATGNVPNIKLGLAISDEYSAGIIGLVQENISNNSNGIVITQGQIENINTSMFSEGDKLWLSDQNYGDLVNVRPLPPSHGVFIGNVIRSHPNKGIIEITVQNGYELSDELHNVASGSPTSGQILQYSSGLWWAKTFKNDPAYFSAVHTQNQTNSGTANDHINVSFDSVSLNNKFSINNNQDISFNSSGLYSINFSAKVNNHDSEAPVYFWFEKNNVSILNSLSSYEVVQSSGEVAVQSLNLNMINNFSANDVLNVKWASPSEGMVLQSFLSSGSMPDQPSAVLNIQEI